MKTGINCKSITTKRRAKVARERSGIFKIAVFITRSVLLIAAGVCLELGTSYLGGLANGELEYLWKVLIIAALFGVYLWYSSTVRPIKSLDNDVSGPLAVLIFIVTSFADNFLAELFDALAPQNITGAVLLILLGSVLIFLNIFVVDRFYEKFDPANDPFYFNSRNGDSNGNSREQWQKQFNSKIIASVAIASLIVVLVAAISIYWIGVDLWWRG